MLSGWACFRDKVPFCKKHLAEERGGLIFEVSVFSTVATRLNSEIFLTKPL